jgi:hypothetical protein
MLTYFVGTGEYRDIATAPTRIDNTYPLTINTVQTVTTMQINKLLQNHFKLDFVQYCKTAV